MEPESFEHEVGEGLPGPKGGDEEWVLHSPLHVAAYTGDLTKLQAILESGTTVRIE